VVEQPIRNRQVASSTLALGSNISLQYSNLAESLNDSRLICCKVAASFKLLVERVERGNLRFIHALYVHVHRESDVAVTEDGLYVFVRNAERVQIGCEAAAKCVPAVP
jgi:hypothetical protein